MDKVQVPRPVIEMQDKLMKAKALIQRLDKGQKIIQDHAYHGSVQKAAEGARLFSQVANELNDLLEDALFIHEQLTTGKTTVISRKGKPANSSPYRSDDIVVVDAFTLRSLREIKEMFGEESIIDIEVVSE